jgi:hypothetical protein
MIGYAGSSVGYPAADADSFSWMKTVVPGAGPIVWEAANYGEPFPGETMSGVTDGAIPQPPEDPYDVIDTLWWTGNIEQHILGGQTISWTTDLPQVQGVKMKIKYGLWNSPNVPLNVYVNNNFVGTALAQWGYISPGPEYAVFGIDAYIVAGPDVIEVRAGAGGEAVIGYAGAGRKSPTDNVGSDPFSFKLNPNPFNPTTAISYQLSAFSQVSLKVYDLSGRLVTTLVDGWREAGSHQVTFDGSNLASGVYLYALQAEGRTVSGKMMLVK